MSEPTEQLSLQLDLSNIGHAPCSLWGYPGISLVDAAGRLLPLVSAWRGDLVVTASPPVPVDLAPGATADVMVNKGACELGDADVAASLRLIPPDDTGALVLDLAGLRVLDACTGDQPWGATLDVSPVEPTAAATRSR